MLTRVLAVGLCLCVCVCLSFAVIASKWQLTVGSCK